MKRYKITHPAKPPSPHQIHRQAQHFIITYFTITINLNNRTEEESKIPSFKLCSFVSGTIA